MSRSIGLFIFLICSIVLGCGASLNYSITKDLAVVTMDNPDETLGGPCERIEYVLTRRGAYSQTEAISCDIRNGDHLFITTYLEPSADALVSYVKLAPYEHVDDVLEKNVPKSVSVVLKLGRKVYDKALEESK